MSRLLHIGTVLRLLLWAVLGSLLWASPAEAAPTAGGSEALVLNLLLLLAAGWLGGLLANRIGYPAVLGELLVGMVLGPPLLGLLQSGPIIDGLAEVGVMLMMLFIGMEVDPADLKRASKGGLLAALGGFIVPFTLCYAAIVWAAGAGIIEVVSAHRAGIFVGVAAGVTSLATKSRILVDLKILDTRIAHVMMAGALVADTLSLIIFAAVLSVGEGGSVNVGELVVVALKVVAFFAVAAALGRFVLPWIGHRLRGLGRSALFTFVLLVGFGFAELAELAGLHGILGTFVAGLFLRDTVFGTTLTHAVTDLVRNVSVHFLAPIFFVTAGFAVTLSVFTESLGMLLLIIGLATVGKIVGTALFYLFTGHGWREGVTLGAGMNGRGAVEIIIAQIGLSMGLIGQDVFSILVVMAITTTAMVPLFLKWGTEWLRNRGELVRSGAREGVLIIGAGPLARRLAKTLTGSVVLLDRNATHVARAEADGLRAFAGSALDENALRDAGASTAGTLIVLTPNAELNTLTAQIGQTTFGIPNVLVPDLSGRVGTRAAREHVGAHALFGQSFRLTDWDFYADRDVLTVDEIPLPAHGEAPVPTANQLPMAVRRDTRVLPYSGGADTQAGDRIVVLRRSDVETAPEQDRFDALVRTCPVVDLKGPLPMVMFFEQAADVLAPRVGVDAERLSTQLMQREAASNTVILPGLAIPHVVVPGEGRFEMLMARCHDGIAFPEQAQRVRAAFVLVGTMDERNFHLRALSAIAQIVQREGFEQAWREAADEEGLRRLMLSFERRRA